MRQQNRALALILVGAGIFLSWISGCSDVQENCELLVNCPETKKPAECGGPLYSSKCDACLQANCCQQVSDCLGNNPCGTYCMFGVMPPSPDCNAGVAGTYFADLTTCLTKNCAAACGESSYCNPVTHNGCPSDGTQCELVYPGIFACIPPGGLPAQICQPCNFTVGPYCGSGLRCDITSLQCARYCCTDADCGTGRCELNQNVVFGYSTANSTNMVGLCLMQDSAAGPACDAPGIFPGIPPPSGGMCFQGFAP
jgi:hypothetical protein